MPRDKKIMIVAMIFIIAVPTVAVAISSLPLVLGIYIPLSIMCSGIVLFPRLLKRISRIKQEKRLAQINAIRSDPSLLEDNNSDVLIRRWIKRKSGKEELGDYEKLLIGLYLWKLKIYSYQNLYIIAPTDMKNIHPHHRVFFSSDHKNPRKWQVEFIECIPENILPIFPYPNRGNELYKPLSTHFVRHTFDELTTTLINKIRFDGSLLELFMVSRNFEDLEEFKIFYDDLKKNEDGINYRNLHNFRCHLDIFFEENPDTKNVPIEWLKHLYQV